MQKYVQIPIELFDDLVALQFALNDKCDYDTPLFARLLDRVTRGIREKMKSSQLRNIYQEAITEKNANPDSDAFQNYRNTKILWKRF